MPMDSWMTRLSDTLAPRTSRVIACALTLLAASHASAQAARPPAFVPRVLIDRELRAKPVKLVSIDRGQIQFLDVGNLIRSEPLDKYLAIVTAGPVTRAASLEDRVASVSVAELPGALPWSPGEVAKADVLTLVDGERLTGRADGREASPDQFLTWNHPTFGLFRFPIERIRRIDVSPASSFAIPPQPKSKDDLLLLANGDRLEGFIASLGDPVKIEVDKKPVTIPWARVGAAFFAAPPTPRQGTMIWLADGTIVRTGPLASTPGKLVRVTPEPLDANKSQGQSQATPADLPLNAIAAVAFDASILTPLSSLTSGAPTPDVRVQAGLDQPLGMGVIEFGRPTSMELTLPKGASRLAFRAELPPDCWSWGDCDLVLTLVAPSGKTEILRRKFNAESSSADVNLPLTSGGTLVISLEEGAYGPIQDRVVISSGLVLHAP